MNRGGTFLCQHTVSNNKRDYEEEGQEEVTLFMLFCVYVALKGAIRSVWLSVIGTPPFFLNPAVGKSCDKIKQQVMDVKFLLRLAARKRLRQARERDKCRNFDLWGLWD